MLGKKQVEQLSGLTSSFVTYGVGAFIAMVYLTDWRVITNFIPFYSGKYADEPKKDPKEC